MTDKANDIRLSVFFEDLRSASAAEERRSNWAMSLLYRRPGIYCAFLFARAGWTPSMVTLGALLVALTLPLQAWLWPLGFAPWAVFATGVLFQTLDCADGALARQTNQSSQRGGDLDFLVDMAQWALLYLAIGILADRTLDTAMSWTALAAAAAWARLMARVVRDRLHRGGDTPTASAPSMLDNFSLMLGGISGLFPFLALTGSSLHAAVIFLFLYALLDIGEGLAPLFRR